MGEVQILGKPKDGFLIDPAMPFHSPAVASVKMTEGTPEILSTKIAMRRPASVSKRTVPSLLRLSKG